MKDRETLALLIPAYNAAAYLPRLLASAFAQTERFDEIWVYDDASTDDTAAVAESLGAKVLRGSVNLGCSAGKNALARHVHADWLHFHDADDALLPNFVALARRWIARGGSDVVLFAYEYREDITGDLLSYRRFDSTELSRNPRSYAILNQINAICGLYRRDAFLEAGGYDEDARVLYNEDVAFHIALAFAGLSFDAEGEAAIINFRRTNSMSSANQLACARAHYHVMRKTAERPDALPYSEEIATKLWAVSGNLAANLDWKTADAAATLARKMGHGPYVGSMAFRTLAALSPKMAIRVREGLIRALRPHLRVGYPRRAIDDGSPATPA